MPRVRRSLASAAFAACLSLVASPAVAANDDPLRASSTEGWAQPHESSTTSLRFREYVEQLPDLFIRASPSLAEPPKSTVESKVITWDFPHTKVMLGMHVRRTSGNDRVIGALTAADSFAFTQQGLMFAWRAGVQRGWFRLYAVAGAGGMQVVAYDLAGHEAELFGTQPRVAWSGLLTSGIGLELQVSSKLTIGTEYDEMMLTAAPKADVVWPDPKLVIRSWFTGLKIVY